MGIEQALFGRLSLYIPHQQTTGNGTLLNTVAAGSRKIGKVLDGASRGNSIALRGLSPPVVPSHLTRRLRFQQTTGKRVGDLNGSCDLDYISVSEFLPAIFIQGVEVEEDLPLLRLHIQLVVQEVEYRLGRVSKPLLLFG